MTLKINASVPPPPENVVVVRFDSTSIGVSWTKFTLVELKGLANYSITYSIIIGSRKRQSQVGGSMTVPWTQNQVIISDLQPGAEYDITVRTLTSAGISGNISGWLVIRHGWMVIIHWSMHVNCSTSWSINDCSLIKFWQLSGHHRRSGGCSFHHCHSSYHDHYHSPDSQKSKSWI